MAVAEQDQTEQQDQGIDKGAALKAAGAAAATGAAALAVQKMLTQRSKGAGSSDKGEKGSNGSQSSLLASAAAGGWDAARDALLPLAENAASLAGKYVAEHGPDIVRERVVPRFIDAFKEATD